jgi:hypothetical protein
MHFNYGRLAFEKSKEMLKLVSALDSELFKLLQEELLL